MRLCELKEKDVINICTCKKIGCVVDLEFDKKSCHVTALIVSQGIHFFNLFCNDELVIPWCNIKQIGPDVILVEIPCQTYASTSPYFFLNTSTVATISTIPTGSAIHAVFTKPATMYVTKETIATVIAYGSCVFTWLMWLL